MPILTAYQTPSGPVYGLLVNGIVHEWGGDPFSGQPSVPGRPLGAPDTLQLVPPVRPSKIVCIGRNYAAHAAEHQAAVPDEPMLFLKPPSALIGHQAVIEYLTSAGRVEHEAELAIIIGKTARKVSQGDALNYALGYTCANDVSARDYQKKDGQWGRAKGFDTFCPLGPWINTDLNPADLAIRCYVNDELRQDSRTSLLVFNVPTLISFISHVMTLLPGDVILTGTPAGVSPILDGDVVRVEIEGIGTLRNSVRVG